MDDFYILNSHEEKQDFPVGIGWKSVKHDSFHLIYHDSCFSDMDLAKKNIIANCIFMYLLKFPKNGSKYWKFVYEERTTDLLIQGEFINVYSLLLSYPQTIKDKIDVVLMNLHLDIKTFGESIDVDYITNKPRSFLPEGKRLYSSANAMYKAICDMGLFDDGEMTFTVAGWQRIDEFQKKHNSQSKRIFIASRFKDNKETIDAIKKSIIEEHFVPVTLYEHQTNDYIMPEMFRLIDESIALVADITDENPNVMFEVGYAKGIGIDVILISKTDIDNEGNVLKTIHSFDISQISIVYYKGFDDLNSKLRFRIVNTLKPNN